MMFSIFGGLPRCENGGEGGQDGWKGGQGRRRGEEVEEKWSQTPFLIWATMSIVALQMSAVMLCFLALVLWRWPTRERC